MEQILQKLSEIEITAQRIMQDADRTKAALSAEMEQQCKDLDLELEQETNRKIQALRDSLESPLCTSKQSSTLPIWMSITKKITSSFRKTYSNNF